MLSFYSEILDFLGSSARSYLPRLGVTLAVIFLAFLINRIFVFFLMRRRLHTAMRRHGRRLISYLTVMIVILILIPVWVPLLRLILPVLGIFGAGLLITFKEVFLNLAGWFYIILRKPFEIGNRIRIHNEWGDVLDIKLMGFTMIEVASFAHGGQSTGRIVHMPNSAVLTTAISNASREFMFNWNEIQLSLQPGSNWERAADLMESIADEILDTISEDDSRIQLSEAQFSIRYAHMRPRVYVEYRPGAILLTLRHLVEPRNIRSISDQIWRKLLAALELEKNIRLVDAYIG